MDSYSDTVTYEWVQKQWWNNFFPTSEGEAAANQSSAVFALNGYRNGHLGDLAWTVLLQREDST